jgi:hypothetical protein
MEAEIVMVSELKTGQVRLDRIEVYSGADLLSGTEVNTFLPYWKGNSVISFFIACLLGISFLFWDIYKKDLPVHNPVTHWIAFIGCALILLEAYNITPAIIILLLLLIGPFILQDPIQITSLMVLGCFYVWAVLCKRSSIKDFLRGAFIP